MVWSGETILPGGANPMGITNISDAKAQLSSLIEKVLAGEEVLIGKARKASGQTGALRAQRPETDPRSHEGQDQDRGRF